MTIDACERSVDGPGDSPHVLDSFGISREDGLVIQLEKIFPFGEKARFHQWPTLFFLPRFFPTRCLPRNA